MNSAENERTFFVAINKRRISGTISGLFHFPLRKASASAIRYIFFLAGPFSFFRLCCHLLLYTDKCTESNLRVFMVFPKGCLLFFALERRWYLNFRGGGEQKATESYFLFSFTISPNVCIWGTEDFAGKCSKQARRRRNGVSPTLPIFILGFCLAPADIETCGGLLASNLLRYSLLFFPATVWELLMSGAVEEGPEQKAFSGEENLFQIRFQNASKNIPLSCV